MIWLVTNGHLNCNAAARILLSTSLIDRLDWSEVNEFLLSQSVDATDIGTHGGVAPTSQHHNYTCMMDVFCNFQQNLFYHRALQAKHYITGCKVIVEKGWPPLRSIEHRDIADSKQRHAFTEYLFLMKKLQKRVDRVAGVWYPQPTNEQTDAMFDIASNAIALPATSSQGRKRALDMMWSTVVRELRQAEKRLRSCGTTLH